MTQSYNASNLPGPLFPLLGPSNRIPDCLQSPYPYTAQLQQLQACMPAENPQLPQELLGITTPLVLHQWQQRLLTHPDRQFSALILEGIQFGFRIGFNYQTQQLKPRKKNLRSATEHPEVVEAYLRKEVAQTRLIPIPNPTSLPWYQTNAFGVIPKKNKPGKWRLIVDLSAPQHHSVNDFIQKDTCSFSYISIDDVARTVARLGQGCLLAKADIKEAFRIVPIHPSDRLLLAMQWGDQLYLDTALPFGLRSAPLIFTAVADAIEWIIRQQGVQDISHYVDDFIFFGAPHSQECAVAMGIGLQTLDILGAPIEPDKSEGPATILPILGIEVDTNLMQLRLPEDKLVRLQQSIAAWRTRKCCTKRDLLSLIGTLQHAAKVVRPGRAFIRRMIDLSMVRSHPSATLRLNREFRADLEWWFQFAANWNGVSILAPAKASVPDGLITSDASGSWGCGAYHNQRWFQLQWTQSTINWHITSKELLPIVVAAAIWGSRWAGKTIKALCDNMAVVHILRSHHSKDPTVMHLVRCLSLIEATYDFTIVSEHLPGKHNSLADALSRDNLAYFLSYHPQAQPDPTPIPIQLRKSLTSERLAGPRRTGQVSSKLLSPRPSPLYHQGI